MFVVFKWILILELKVSDLTSEQEEYSEAYLCIKERHENVQAFIKKEIEDDQVSVSERLVQIEKMMLMLVKRQMFYVNRSPHTKRHRKKRNLPGTRG